jgi:hypothetical protein
MDRLVVTGPPPARGERGLLGCLGGLLVKFVKYGKIKCNNQQGWVHI